MTLTVEEKAAWVACLRSGEFDQIKGNLTDGCNGRCALGVLCEVLGKPAQRLDQPSYNLLSMRGIDFDPFWQMNDIDCLDFGEIAERIEQTDLDDRMFNFRLPPSLREFQESEELP